MKKIIVLFALSLAAASQATDVLWIQMNVNHSYKDLSTSCKSVKPGGDLIFAAEHENGRLTRVVLNNFPYVWPYTYIYKSIELTKDQVSQVELFKDKKDRYWVKKFPLPGHVLRWILYWATAHFSFCALPQPLWTISPSPVTYDFETEGIEEGILISYSQKLAFMGQRSDGEAYEATMQLVQREYKAGGFP